MKRLIAAVCMAAIASVAVFTLALSGPVKGSAPTPTPAPVATPTPTPVVTPTPTPTPAPQPQAATYNVRAGDSLWSVAVALYGNRVNACYTVLYRENAATIEAAARAHGHKTSQHGRWLFVGTVLKLPDGC